MRSLRVLIVLLPLAAAAAVVWPLKNGSAWQRMVRFFNPPSVPPPFDPAFIRLPPEEIAALPLAVRFDQPLGSPHGALTYNAQPFRVTRHLGDDLNGIGGQNSDLGDPVYAAGAGRVVFTGEPGSGWGNMVILMHRIPDLENPGQERVVQTVYAHLDRIRVTIGQVASRGEVIGTVGTGGGLYLAHLHFEVREGPYINPSVGYADAPLNRLSPERFLTQYRGAPDDQLNPPPH
ncbi:MAG TPA: M23 family metallopeptidase [Prosthecobacter sp.]|nr:M23 family metallopeptidase [Prosthecobacter sp.]